MNGKKSKLIRKQAEKLQVQWINSLLTEDADKVTHQTLNHLSFMNHKWVEKKIKKNSNITLDELIKVNG